MKKEIVSLSVLIFASIAIMLSVMFFSFKLESKGFHTRDFAFYMEFYSKLFDSRLTNQYSLNPEGFNMFKMEGVESTHSFHQALHLEPIKYLCALIHHLFGGPASVFVFFSFVYFLPIMYLARFYPCRDKYDSYFLVFISLLYFVYPSTLEAVSFDVRPYALIGPFFFLTILSIYLRRPRWESGLFFTLLLFSREEGLVFGGLAILFVLATHRFSKEWRPLLHYMSVTLGLWALVIFGYFAWTGYEININLQKIVSLITHPLVIPVILACVVVCWYSYRHMLAILKRLNLSTHVLQVLVYLLVFVPLGYQLIGTRVKTLIEAPFSTMGGILHRLYFEPRFKIYFICAVMLLILCWRMVQKVSHKHLILGAIVGFMVGSVMSKVSYLHQTLDYSAYDSAQLVKEIRNDTDKYNTAVLVDYETYQSFYDYEHVYVYNRLPWTLVEGDVRYYPNEEAVSALVELLRNKIEYIVITHESTENIKSLLERSGMEGYEVIAENELYRVMWLVEED